MDEQNNNQSIINEEPVVVEKNGSKKFLAAIILLAAITILGGGFFAYASFFSPFLLKSNVDITKTAYVNTQKIFSEGQFTVDATVNIEAKPAVNQVNVGEFKIAIPVKMDIGEMKDNKTFNTHLSIGDIDFSPVFLGMSQSNPGLNQVNKGDFSVNLETISIGSDFFAKINKLPSMVAMFVPANILNKWIKISNDFVVNSASFINLPNQQKIELTEEQKKIVEEKIIAVIVEDAKPIIKREKTDIGLKISYKYDLKYFTVAFLAALKELGKEIPEWAEFSDLIDDNTDFTNEINGSFDISYYINKKSEIERVDYVSVINSEAGTFIINTSANIVKNTGISINEPENFVSLEDLLKQINLGLVF
jgi:hypothetical protein